MIHWLDFFLFIKYESNISIVCIQSKVNDIRLYYSVAIAIMQVRFFAIFKMSFTISSQGMYGRFQV